jgi:hypothetical protein
MKKYSFGALIALFILVLSGCSTQEDGIRTYSQNYIIYWETNHRYFWDETDDKSGLYYYCTIKEPNLTNDVFNNGQMNAYLRYVPGGSSSVVLAPLPYSDFLTEINDDGDIYKWEEQMTVEFEPGYITFILKADDHSPLPPFYESYEFVVRFLW